MIPSKYCFGSGRFDFTAISENEGVDCIGNRWGKYHENCTSKLEASETDEAYLIVEYSGSVPDVECNVRIEYKPS